jgi:YfiH family protein
VNADWILPHWAAPAGVRALSTTRAGGYSAAPWASLNLGLNSGDDPALVLKNRAVLRACLPAEPKWLHQEHGVNVFMHPHAKGDLALTGSGPEPALSAAEPVADAQVASQPGQVCVVLTADCLPVLFCNRGGTRVAAAHAGWRGLLAGVLEQTVHALGEPPDRLMAWLGPAISARAYEVGDELRAAFVRQDGVAAAACFQRQGERWLFDLYAMARHRLARAGVAEVSGGSCCTYHEPQRFFSYRRDGRTGRMASLVWLEPNR